MNWNIRRPRVYRYMDKKYADAFFETGQLMLSSFEQFAEHSDEQRLDAKEGLTHLVHRTNERGGQTFHVEAEFGHDAYILCGSHLPSLDLMHAFGADSGIVIIDSEAFAKTVATALQGYRYGFDGPCAYQYRRIVEFDLGWLELGPSEDTDDESQMDMTVVNAAVERMKTRDVYFLKDAGYVAQAEWRFVWLVDHNVQKNITIDVPDARKYCARWEDMGDLVSFGKGRL